MCIRDRCYRWQDNLSLDVRTLIKFVEEKEKFIKNSKDNNYFLDMWFTLFEESYKLDVYKRQPDDTIEFLFIARVMKEKGIDQYLEAAEIIRKKYPHTRFHVLGFCEEAYEDILKAYEARGEIQYHGLQDDVRVFHQSAHCTIHPSYYPEGMSNVLLESEACGRPVDVYKRQPLKKPMSWTGLSCLSTMPMIR